MKVVVKLNVKIITDVTTEPLTLSEVKMHLRLDSNSLSDDLTTTQSIAPASRSAGTTTGNAVDIYNKTAIVNLNSGTNQSTGTLDLKIQESDDNIVFTDYYSFTQVTTANDNAVYEKQYTGSKRYIRAFATVANANCEFSVDIITSSNTNIEDSLLSSLITVAREYCETFTRRGLATQTRELMLDDFPDTDYIELPYSPAQSITSIKYKDSSGTETTWGSSSYILNSDTMPALITPVYGGTWASFTPYPTGAVKIRYVCGHSASNPVSQSIKHAMLILIAHLYENREATSIKELTEVPFSVKALLTTYKIFGW